MQYLLPLLVLAAVIATGAAWFRAAGGDGIVADAELVDVTEAHQVPAHFGAPARHALATAASRRVPLVSVRPGPRFGQAWLHFADGTELLAEEEALGTLGLLAVDLAWHGPASIMTITASQDDCWATVGRLRGRVRLVDGRHPEALGAPRPVVH